VQPPSCGGVVEAYKQQFGMYLSLYQWLNLVPLVIGLFVGAPLVAREVERGTHLLAWTQGVTRVRWITTKVLLLAMAAVLAGTVYTLLMTWWRQPLDAIDGSGMRPDAFDLEGIVPIGYFVAALAIGIAAGTLIRRTIPAMGVAIVAFLVLRFGTIGLLRPNFMAPLVSSAPFGSFVTTNTGWLLQDNLINATGRSLNGRFALDQVCNGAILGSKQSFTSCLAHHGIIESITYQPASRFWAFQAIELGLFLSVAAALLCLTVWWVHRRIS
jgi:ABC-type transport system involved in multi-copper enzyme maturation permease subunit